MTLTRPSTSRQRSYRARVTEPTPRLPQRGTSNVNLAALPLTATALPGSMPRPGSNVQRASCCSSPTDTSTAAGSPSYMRVEVRPTRTASRSGRALATTRVMPSSSSGAAATPASAGFLVSSAMSRAATASVSRRRACRDGRQET